LRSTALEIDPAGRPPEMIELSVFRIIQEDCVMYASTLKQAMLIILQRTPSASLLVQLEDDGKGLMAPADLGALSLGKHYGLVGISERVALLGGHMTIESPREGGTILLVEIPSPSPVVT
jgi:glucose-6-phosphate-specific signal transduction histidine kinase